MNTDSSLRRARVAAVVSALLFVAVLVVGGMRSEREKPAPISIVYTPEYEVAAFTIDRDALRRQEIERLEGLVLDEELSADVRTDAARRIMALQEWMEREATVGAVLRARGYEWTVITMHENSVNVVLKVDALSREEAEMILELVTRETGVSGGNVKIIPMN